MALVLATAGGAAAQPQPTAFRPTPQLAQRWRAENLRAIRFAEVRFRNIDLPLALMAVAEEVEKWLGPLWVGMEVIEGDDMFLGALPGPNTKRFSMAADNITLEDLLRALQAKDPRYRLEIDDTTATINLFPAETPPDYWATRQIGEFSVECANPWAALNALLRRGELEGSGLTSALPDFMLRSSRMEATDLGLDPVRITISTRRGWTVRRLLNLIVRKTSVAHGYGWQATWFVRRSDGIRLMHLAIAPCHYNVPRPSLNVEAVVRIDMEYRRPHWNTDNVWW